MTRTAGDRQSAHATNSTSPRVLVLPHAEHQMLTGTWSISSTEPANGVSVVTTSQHATSVSGTT